jgi:hypothetical protein
MADIWTSHGDIISRLLMQLKTSSDAHEAMAHALTHKQQVLDKACKQMHQKTIDTMQERDSLLERVSALEAELARAHESVLDQHNR